MANSSVKIFRCLVILCVLMTTRIHGRSLHRTHLGHHHRPRNLAELEMEREMIEDQERNLPVRHSRGWHIGHAAKSIEQSYLDTDDEISVALNSADGREYRRRLPFSSRRYHAIRKRHNGATDDVAYEIMSQDEEADYRKSRARGIHHRGALDVVKNKRYEVEVKEAQNSSLCNYTVVDVPDPSPDESRTPKNLVNVMCNHAGSRCRTTGTYCCIQTYSKIDVSYGDGTTEIIKVYTGCVCSLRLYGELKQYTPQVPINY